MFKFKNFFRAKLSTGDTLYEDGIDRVKSEVFAAKNHRKNPQKMTEHRIPLQHRKFRSSLKKFQT